MQHAGGARDRAMRGRVSSRAPVNNCKRSHLWSPPRGELAGIAHNRELLHLASMIHDLALVLRLDNHLAPLD